MHCEMLEYANSRQEDPYHLKLFGKAANDLEVVAAEYLPDGKELYIIIIDAERVLHVYQYDPASEYRTQIAMT